MTYFGNQLRQILRRLARTPGFTATTLITLAIGIGANTAIFSVVDGVLLKPLPYPHPEQLVSIRLNSPAFPGSMQMSPSDYFVYRDQNRMLQDIGLYSPSTVSVTGNGEPEEVPVMVVTDGMLPLLRVPPMLGRWFTRSDDSPQGVQTAILGYQYWQKRFGGRSNAVGGTTTVNGHPVQIIGVMPPGYNFLDNQEPAMFIPFQFDRNKTFLGNFSYNCIARLKPGSKLREANADAARMLPIVLRAFPPPPGLNLQEFQQLHIASDIHSLKQDIVGDTGELLWILMGNLSFVLLIACSNAANLLLVRAEGRQQELAIRAALGAGRGWIAAEILAESTLIALLASVIGLGLAYGSLRLLVLLAPRGLSRLQEIGIDTRVLLFTLLVALFASLLAGLIPAFKYAVVRDGTNLRESHRTQSHGRERHHARDSLVVVQVGLAFVLLISSGLMIRTFHVLAHVNPGFTSPSSVQTFRIMVPDAEVKDPEGVVRMQQAIQEKIAAIPGVSSVAWANGAPMDGDQWLDPVFVRDHLYGAKDNLVRRFKFVSPGFFQALGVPLWAGRNFTWEDTYQKLPVAIISENFAREYWGDARGALGKQIRVGSTDDWREIIGVVGNVHEDSVAEDPASAVYWPLLVTRFEGDPGVETRRSVAFVIRSPRAGSENFMNEVRQAVWSVDANLPLANVHTLDYFYMKSMARTSFTLVMLGIAGAAGLLLGIVGLYSVIAYSVAQRKKEIGIRMALGAQREALVKMFVRQGLMLTGLGVICGLAAAAGLTRLMRSLLFHVSTLDPITYVGVSVILMATAVLASYVPSRRAATVDPVETLRAE